MRLKVLVINIKFTYFWDVMLCCVVEGLATTMFRVQEASPKIGAVSSSKCLCLSAILGGITSQEI